MAEVVGYVAEVEQGSEIQFCPILQQPIIRSQRVRTLPGFHLLSLGAGREALARGYYDAFGQRFSCAELEYLHPDDKVFICAEDHKAFKNRMSMQYHRYIRHELEERKLERKRMRERATERQARSAAHAARQQQQQQAPVAAKTAVASGGREADPRSVSTSSVAPPAASTAGAEAASQLLAINDPYGDSGESRVTHDPYAVAEDGEPHSDAPALAAVPISTASTVVASKPPASAPAAVVVAQPPKKAQVKPPSVDEDDLYGDVAGPEVKKQKTASTYASAIGAMMTDDFDEDE